MERGNHILPRGSRVGVFAPSGNYDRERLELGVGLLREWGYEVLFSPHLGRSHRYLAGTDDERLQDLVWALTSPDIDAAWMARGGYGLTRILGGVPFGRVAPRPVIGFSDGTALHVALRQSSGLRGLHGPVLHSLADHTAESSREALRGLLQEGRPVDLVGSQALPGVAEGPVVGGNLCMLATLCGTRWQLDATGAILLLEEIGEPAYKVDRMIQQLQASGVLDGVLAVALGGFTSCAGPGEGVEACDHVVELLEPLGVPVLTGLPVGHGPDNHPFWYGSRGRVVDGALVFGALAE